MKLKSLKEWSGAMATSRCPANRRSKLTLPFDSPDSQRLIGRIVSHAKRPVPVWWILLLSAGTAEPVKMNCPGFPRRSTVNRAASHNCGANCHSSINRGTSPSSNASGFSSARKRFRSNSRGQSIYNTLLAAWAAVVVFPHHLGPCISTAPAASNCSKSNWSAILNLYIEFSSIIWLLLIRCKNTTFLLIYKVFCIFHSVSWLVFIPSVGRFSFRQLAGFHSVSWPVFYLQICPLQLSLSAPVTEAKTLVFPSKRSNPRKAKTRASL